MTKIPVPHIGGWFTVDFAFTPEKIYWLPVGVQIPSGYANTLKELPKWEMVDDANWEAYFIFDTEEEAIDFAVKYILP